MLHRGVEVNRVTGIQCKILAAYLYIQSPIYKVQELDAGMIMRLGFLSRNILELRQKGIDLALGGGIVETFEEVCDVCGSGSLGKSDPIFFSHHRDDAPLTFVGKKIFQADTEDQRDAKQSRQGREEFAPFQLGKQGRGQTGMAAEFHQSHAFFQAKGAHFLPNRVWF